MSFAEVNMKRLNKLIKKCIVPLICTLCFEGLPTVNLYAKFDTTSIVLNKKVLEATNDSVKASLYKDLCWYFRYINLDSSVSYGKKSIAYAQKANATILEAEANRFIGIVYWHYAYEEESLEWIYTSLKLSESVNDKSGQAYSYDNIGNSFYSQGFFDKALENFTKAKNIFTEINDQKGISYTLLHLSRVYIEKKDLSKALELAKQAVEMRQKWGDTILTGNAQKEMANVYSAMGNYNLAISIYKESLQPLLKKGLSFNIADHYQQMAETYRLSQQLDSALVYGLKSMDLAKDFNNYRQIIRTAKTLEQIYKVKKDFANTLYYENLYFENRERLVNDKIAVKLSRKDLEHEYEIKAAKIRTRQIIIISVLSVLLLLIACIAIAKSMSKKKIERYNQLLETKNSEIEKQKQVLEDSKNELSKLNDIKNKMFSVVSHDIRSPLASLQTMLELYNISALSAEEMIKMFPQISELVNNTSNFVDNLLHWANSQFKGIKVIKTNFNLKDSINDELKLLQKKSGEKKISFSIDINDSPIVFADKNMIGIIIRNLLNNALKFTNANTSINIRSTQNENEVFLSIKDEGVGMTQQQLKDLFVAGVSTHGTGNEKGTGLGLILCKDFIEKNDGRIWVESEAGKGSTFNFSLPKGSM